MNIKEKNKRFQDQNKCIYEFADEFLIICPNCSKQAKVLIAENINFNPAKHLFLPRKLICLNCGLSKRKQTFRGEGGISFSNTDDQSGSLVIGGGFDWYFQEQLWLQNNCCNKTLWAYNEKHLEFIENYVASKLRSRTPKLNKSLASRLPQWIKAARNRDEILKTVGKLKEKLNGKS